MNRAKDYRLKVGIRNNRILSLIERLSPSVAVFAKERGLDYQRLGGLICMRLPAKKMNGEWLRIVVDLATALGVEPEELFTDRQLAGLTKSTVIRNIDEEDMLSLDGPDAVALLTHDDVDEKIYAHQVAGLVAELNDRQKFIVGRRFNDNATYRQIAEELGISLERARQIEQGALRKMRRKLRLRDKDCEIQAVNLESIQRPAEVDDMVRAARRPESPLPENPPRQTEEEIAAAAALFVKNNPSMRSIVEHFFGPMP